MSDIQLISDKDSIPHGYCFIAEHLEASEYIHTYILFCCKGLLTLHNEFISFPALSTMKMFVSPNLVFLFLPTVLICLRNEKEITYSCR